jgi:hypothetical protein
MSRLIQDEGLARTLEVPRKLARAGKAGRSFCGDHASQVTQIFET